jgi:hypothetical protein
LEGPGGRGEGVSEQPTILLNVSRDDKSLRNYPAFSNFVQVSRVATEVQLEFLFVDISQLASVLIKAKEAPGGEPCQLSGLSVAKVVMPALNFVQIKDHMNEIFDAIEKELGKVPSAKEVKHGSGNPLIAC